MNLLELVRGQLSDERLARLAAIVGESAAATRKALDGAALPAVLGGLASEYSGDAGAARLLELMRAGGHDGTLLNTLDGALAGGAHADALLNLGKGQLGAILGDRIDAVTELMAADTGIRRSSASALLGLLVPVVLAVLGRQLQSGGGSARLAEWLAGARAAVAAHAAPGLATTLGAARPAAPAAALAAQRQGAVWPYLIVPAVALAMFFSLRSCQQDSMRAPLPSEAAVPQGAAATATPAADAARAEDATPAPEDAPVESLVGPSEALVVGGDAASPAAPESPAAGPGGAAATPKP
jgi:hypothetical protein